MRATLLALLTVALSAASGCSIEYDDGEPEEECDTSATYRGERLTGVLLERGERRALPAASGSRRLRANLCGDRGIKRFTTLEGVPPESAVVRDDMIFLGTGFLIATQDHPLHKAFAASLHVDPRPVRGCRPYRTTGRILEEPLVMKSLFIDFDGRRLRDVTMHPRMRADLPEVGGLPRVRRGMRVALTGKLCHSGRFYAMRLRQRG